ncbi:hypothetical protein [Nocardioides sp.]|uniref:hypothetical protein n=1 Tax=Nocardioides sp. TaxID=35761 RepID=UPI0035155B11
MARPAPVQHLIDHPGRLAGVLIFLITLVTTLLSDDSAGGKVVTLGLTAIAVVIGVAVGESIVGQVRDRPRR